MVDASAVFDVDGKKVPDVFLISASFLLIFLIADLGFTGFRANNLGLIVTAFLFVITLITGFGFLKIMFTEGHILDGPFAFLLGTLVFGIALGGFQFSILSTATNSYLSGILGNSDSIVIPIVNLTFAPIGETLLIFGFAAGIHEIVERSPASEWPTALKFAEQLMQDYSHMVRDAVVLGANDTGDTGRAKYYDAPETAEPVDEYQESQAEDGHFVGEMALCHINSRHNILARDPFHNQPGQIDDFYLKDGSAQNIVDESESEGGSK